MTAGVVISMDGRGRLWTTFSSNGCGASIKYAKRCICKAYADGREARAGISSWMNFATIPGALTRR